MRKGSVCESKSLCDGGGWLGRARVVVVYSFMGRSEAGEGDERPGKVTQAV